MTAQGIRISPCSTRVVVNGRRIFGCQISEETADTFTLKKYQAIDVQAEFTQPSSSGTFNQCLGFQENGKKYFFLNHYEEIEARNISKVHAI